MTTFAILSLPLNSFLRLCKHRYRDPLVMLMNFNEKTSMKQNPPWRQKTDVGSQKPRSDVKGALALLISVPLGPEQRSSDDEGDF